MDDASLLDLAILNNVRWCTAVLAAHGVASRTEEHFWTADDGPPPYYGNLVARTRSADGVRAQLARIRALAASPPKPDWGMKDSFDALPRAELEALGLSELFAARWYGLDVGRGGGSQAQTDARIAPVETEDDLARWERAWQTSSPAPGLRIFPASLLADREMRFLAAWRGADVVGGAATNLSEGVVGLSNVFVLDSVASAPMARDLARAVRRRHLDRAVVGYGGPDGMRGLATLGFRDLGPLRVWVASGPKA